MLIGLLLSGAIFIVIVLLVSYVVMNAIEDERELDRWINAENEEIDQL